MVEVYRVGGGVQRRGYEQCITLSQNECPKTVAKIHRLIVINTLLSYSYLYSKLNNALSDDSFILPEYNLPVV